MQRNGLSFFFDGGGRRAPSRERGRKYSLRTPALSTPFPVCSTLRDGKGIHNDVLEKNFSGEFKLIWRKKSCSALS